MVAHRVDYPAVAPCGNIRRDRDCIPKRIDNQREGAGAAFITGRLLPFKRRVKVRIFQFLLNTGRRVYLWHWPDTFFSHTSLCVWNAMSNAYSLRIGFSRAVRFVARSTAFDIFSMYARYIFLTSGKSVPRLILWSKGR